MNRTRFTLAIATVAALGALVLPQAALGHSAKGGRSAIPAQMLTLCHSEHIPCTGHWVTHASGRFFRLSTPFHLYGGNAGVMSPNCSPCLGPDPVENHGASYHCMSSQGGGNGTYAELFTCNGSANQNWWVDGGTTSYFGYVFYNAGDAKCLNNSGGATTNGNHQIMWDCYNSKNETYNPHFPVPQGTEFAMESADNYNYCTSSYGDNSQGAPVLLYSCNFGSNNQLWYSNALL